MTSPYTIWPLRFSPDPAAMIEFFAALGLRTSLSHTDATFATFEGRSGRLGVHTATRTASGEVPRHTALNFVTPDVTAAAAELAAAGQQAQVWDETYGKQGVVITPDGLVIGLNEDTQDDLYGGYQMHGQTVAASMDVVAVCPTNDIAGTMAFFAFFGFTADTPGNAGRVRLRGQPGGGGLILHGNGKRSAPISRPVEAQFGPPYLVELRFETSEPLDALTDRLRHAQYRAVTVEDQARVHVLVTDPDGAQIQIHPTP